MSAVLLQGVLSQSLNAAFTILNLALPQPQEESRFVSKPQCGIHNSKLEKMLRARIDSCMSQSLNAAFTILNFF